MSSLNYWLADTQHTKVYVSAARSRSEKGHFAQIAKIQKGLETFSPNQPISVAVATLSGLGHHMVKES